jgi:hypothetical protein
MGSIWSRPQRPLPIQKRWLHSWKTQVSSSCCCGATHCCRSSRSCFFSRCVPRSACRCVARISKRCSKPVSRRKLAISFRFATRYQACVNGGEHEFTAIVMRACASSGRDVIATLYRLRVVMATPRIGLGDFRCYAGLIEICVPDASRAGHVDCGFRLPQSMAVDYCPTTVNADQTIRPGRRTRPLL